MHNYLQIGPKSAYNSEILMIDGNTGTQIDVPPHSIPRPDSGLPNAGPLGLMFTDKIPAWQFGGEACVVDVRELLDKAPDGKSSLVRRSHIEAWEKAHRPLRAGDVVLLYSGYTDKYYKPLSEGGRRFVADPVAGDAPAWPDPDPDCMDYIASRGVMLIGCDSPSMGPIPDLAEPTHLAGLKYGAIFTESLTNLKQLPTTGAFYCVLGPKHAEGPYGEGRALAIEPGPLASRLIESCREKRAVDLSVVMAKDLPLSFTGTGIGNHRHPYTKADFFFAKNLGLYHHLHMMDSHTGTHLVPPSYALPQDTADYSEQEAAWLKEFETTFGPRGVSDVTTEKVPLEQTCGTARVIDVTSLVGTTNQADWPASPEITSEFIRNYESAKGSLNPGDIVIFHGGHSDQYFKPKPDDKPCIADPLNGKSEGWPAPNAAAIEYLAKKGIRCIATDSPFLGSVDPKSALMTYWNMGRHNIVGVEFLTNVKSVPDKAYFLFAPVKIAGCHGGPGRAIALY